MGLIIRFNNPLFKRRIKNIQNVAQSVSPILIARMHNIMPQVRGNFTSFPKLYSNGHLILKIISSVLSTTSFSKQIRTLFTGVIFSFFLVWEVVYSCTWEFRDERKPLVYLCKEGLKNMKNVVGNFVTCTDGLYRRSKIGVNNVGH